jgi:hypothetical protein
MKRNQHILIRPAEPDDHNFLFATYLNNNWYSKEQTTTLKKSMWMALQHKRLENVLSSGTVKVACLSESPDVVVGYAFPDGERPFSYVKLAWRSPQLDLTNRLLNSLKDQI